MYQMHQHNRFIKTDVSIVMCFSVYMSS